MYTASMVVADNAVIHVAGSWIYVKLYDASFSSKSFLLDDGTKSSMLRSPMMKVKVLFLGSVSSMSAISSRASLVFSKRFDGGLYTPS